MTRYALLGFLYQPSTKKSSSPLKGSVKSSRATDAYALAVSLLLSREERLAIERGGGPSGWMVVDNGEAVVGEEERE